MADPRAESRGVDRAEYVSQPKAAETARDRDTAGRVVHFRSQDGLLLTARIFDAGSDRMPLLGLPGLSRNSQDFQRLGEFFSQHPEEKRRVVAVDYRGRGLSASDPDWRNYTPLVEARDVLTAAAVLGIERAILVGTSRGGIISMLLGALRPRLIAGVVLNDIGPVIEGIGLARIKRTLLTRRRVADWAAARGASKDIGGSQFPALDDEDWRALTDAYFMESPAGLAPAFDPNLLKTVEESTFLEKIPVLWAQFFSLSRVPVFTIRGEHSDILSPRTLAAMAAHHPQFEQLTVPGQGHPPALRDRQSLERILAFTRRCEVPARVVGRG